VLTLILIDCRLRISHPLRRESECLAADADAVLYLRYLNHKMKRGA
jgi:hypothetical protein